MRRYARQTNARLLLGFVLLLFILGDGLIYLFYGRSAAVLGLLCMALGLAPLLAIWALLSLLEWLVKKADEG
jgi:TM2 domain-containing membrane protein YozV